MRLDDPRLADAGRGDPRTCRRSSRSSRSRPTTGCSSRPPCSRTARSGTSTASCSCRRTGCSTSAGSSPPATSCGRCRRGWGSASGSAVCEDFWHLPVPQILALDGAQILINVSSSPGRDLAATNEVGLGTATSWRTLMRTYAQLTTSFVVFCNRVGVDESISFWGGSEVIAPERARRIFSAPLYDEGLFLVDIPTADIRRERIALPLLRDERPELQVRELSRIVAERAGQAIDTNAEPGGTGFDLVPAGEPSLPIGFGVHGKRTGAPRPTEAPARPSSDRRHALEQRQGAARQAHARRQVQAAGAKSGATRSTRSGIPADDRDRTDRRARAALRAADRAGDRHRRRAPGDRRVHPRPARAGRASSAPCWACRAGSIRRSSRTSSPRRSAPERLLCVMMPYRTSSPASRADAEEVVAALGCASELVDISPMVDGYFEPRPSRTRRRRGLDGHPLRRGNFAARMRMAVAVRPVGDVGRARRRDRQQDRVADRLHDALRRLGLRVQPDRRPVQEPGPPAGRRDRRARRDHAQGAVAPTCGPARPTRSRAASATRCSIGCCSGGSTSGGRSTRWSRWASSRRSSSGSTGWSPAPSSSARSRRSPSSGRGRPGVDYLYPRRRPGSARG